MNCNNYPKKGCEFFIILVRHESMQNMFYLKREGLFLHCTHIFGFKTNHQTPDWLLGWVKLLRMCGRITSINSVLVTLPFYFVAVFKLLQWIIKKIEQLRRSFLWKSKETINGFISLVNWKNVCREKKKEKIFVAMVIPY